MARSKDDPHPTARYGKEMPRPATAAKSTRKDPKPSPALSIMQNGPKTFACRKLRFWERADAER
ncbi:MAG TPA: hypothetical protein VG406_20745 [Isosphaeraceae bacterium]|jgi:hypothetical protein|nr:hypothetical protein [Isosphaeraceae bacterium]